MRHYVFAGLAALFLYACSPANGLAPGLTARMDTPGARLDKPAAYSIVNGYRATRAAPALSETSNLSQLAQTLAAQYATNGTQPKKPEGVAAILTSAGYATFAETFSGWRGTQSDADTLAVATAQKSGLGVAYSPNSTYGVYWVLLLAPGQ